jgi:hypothetical protein
MAETTPPSPLDGVASAPSPAGGITRPIGPGTFSPAPERQTPRPNTSPAPVERNQPVVPPGRGAP